ncbi:hypothetical protein IIY24_02575 [Candidatus Saccharibacteria bacterium]|nr:hypothetical protein [Candidatus Saccharibacteria bacterium]
MKSIKIDQNLLEKIKPTSIIYGEYAEGGAMGDCGTARFYTIERKNLKFYYIKDIFNNKENEKIWAKTIEFLRKLEDKGILTYEYGGYGNHAYKPPKANFLRDDDNCEFIYKKEDKIYKISPSCKGVFDYVAPNFAHREIPFEEIEEFRKNNLKNFSPSEYAFLTQYLIQLKRIDSHESWFDFTVIDYLNAIGFIRHKNKENFILNRDELFECDLSFQKYRLNYIVNKLGWNKLNNLITKMIKEESFDLFPRLNDLLEENVKDIFNKIEVINSNQTSLDPLDETCIKNLFLKPVIVNFTKEANSTIIKNILNCPKSSFNLNAKSVAYYLANYILNEDKLPYTDILPAIVHIIEVLPNEDTNHTHIEDLFWICGEIINNAWKYLEETEESQKKYRGLVYDIYWPRVGSLWPVIHYEEFSFKEQSTEKIFLDSLAFVMSLNDIDERNEEIKTFLENHATKIGYKAGSIGRRAFCYTLRNLSSKQELEKIISTVEPTDLFSFLSYPETIEDADNLLAELFREDDDARITGLARLGVFESLVITPNTMNVGEHILTYIDHHFDKFINIFSNDIATINENPANVFTELFIAMSKGISEENEFLPFSNIKKKLLKLGYDKEKLTSAEKYARKHRRTILFQRSALQKFF